MGEHFEKFTYKQQLKRARITAIVLASATVISIWLCVFAFIQKTKAEEANKRIIDCLEEQIILKEQLNQSEQRATKESFQAQQLQESLINQIKVTEELLKQRVNK